MTTDNWQVSTVSMTSKQREARCLLLILKLKIEYTANTAIEQGKLQFIMFGTTNIHPFITATICSTYYYS